MNQELTHTEAKQVAIKPIIFSTEMVKAILAGRKFQTRRIVKHHLDNRGTRTTNVPFEDWHGKEVVCPYGKVGSVLYVRETWVRGSDYTDCGVGCEYGCNCPTWGYKASWPHDDEIKWKPSIHMPRAAARIFLKITDISVERLQDITEEDAIAEGILKDEMGFKNYDKELAKEYGDPSYDWPHLHNPVDSFRSLWESINGPDSWEQNPWIWKITFERIEKPTS